MGWESWLLTTCYSRKARLLHLHTHTCILIACPSAPSIQTVSVKKTKHLELSEKIWLCVKKYLIKFLSNFSSIREKIQTPWTIRFYVVKNTSMKIFLWSKKHKFLDLAMFSRSILGHSQNFTDTILIVQGIWVFSHILFCNIEKWKMDSWTTWTGYKPYMIHTLFCLYMNSFIKS